MPSSATTRNRLEKQGTGENTNTWGQILNAGAFDLIDESLDGRASYTLSGSKTLSSTNYVTDESRKRFQDITGGTGGTVTIPGVEKWYIVRNGSSGGVIFTTGGGATATIPTGKLYVVVCDGTNCRVDSSASDAAASAVTATAQAGIATSGAATATTKAADAETARAAAVVAKDAAVAARDAAQGYADSIDTSNIMHLAGAETATGRKTFSDGIVINGQIIDAPTSAGVALLEAVDAGAQKAILGVGAWTAIGSAATTSGTSVTFSSIPDTYSDLMLLFDQVSGSGAGAIQIAVSANGSTFNTALSITGGLVAGNSHWGSILFPNYNADFGHLTAGIVPMSSPSVATPSTTPDAFAWRADGGIVAIRIFMSSGNFDLGSISLQGR